MASDVHVRIGRLEKTVMEILRRLKQAASHADRALQYAVMPQTEAGGGGGGGFASFATNSGTISGYAAGVVGSGTVTLQTLDPATGLLSAGASVTAWNYATGSITSTTIVVVQDDQANWLVTTEFC